MSDVVIPDKGKQLLIDLLDRSLTLRLYQDISPALGETTDFDDFNECDFSGYLSKDTNMLASREESNEAKRLISMVSPPFAHNGGATSNTVKGWYLTGADESTVVVAALQFGSTVTMAAVGDTINFDVDLCLASKP